MKFKFSLDSVLKVRRHQEKLQKQKLAEELVKKKEIDELKEQVRQKLENYLQDDRSVAAANIHTIKRHGKHMMQTHELIKKIGRESSEAEKNVSEVRNRLTEVHKSRHILEKVKEIEQHFYIRQREKNEQKNMDEIATQLFSR